MASILVVDDDASERAFLQNGLELISLLRDRSSRPAIVAISGTGEPQLDVAEAVGADTTLTKPVSPGALLDGVRRALAATAQRTQGGGA